MFESKRRGRGGRRADADRHNGGVARTSQAPEAAHEPVATLRRRDAQEDLGEEAGGQEARARQEVRGEGQRRQLILGTRLVTGRTERAPSYRPSFSRNSTH